MRKVVARAFVGEQCRDVVVGKIRVFELPDNLIRLMAGSGDAEHRFF
jgi:hypothetical protein